MKNSQERSSSEWSAEATRIKNWFAGNRQLLTGQGNWLLGGEPNTLNPELFANARVRVLLVRLSAYQDVAAGITHSYLYQMAAGVDGCYVDMAFLPPERDEKLLRDAGIPLLTATNSKLPAAAFDVIAISNSVLQELINLPALLHYSDIPLSRIARAARGSPLIFLGGSNSCTHAILHGQVNDAGEQGLVDAVIMGDGEQVFARALSLVRDNIDMPQADLLNLLQSEVGGFYEPSSYEQKFAENGQLCAITNQPSAPMPVCSNKTACRPGSETFTGGPMLYEGPGTSHVILSAGCPSFCSFCKESWEQKPYRETSSAAVMAAALKLKAGMGLNEISLMTFNANTCSDIFSLVEKLSSQFERVAIKSQRFDAVVNSPELLDLQFEAGKRTYTCAMEGISERLRTMLQKNLDETTILTGIDLLLQRNMRQMKVFLILTGYEQSADIDEFRNFLDLVKARIAADNCKPRLTFSFATLFRSPQTPMQYAPPRVGEDAMRRMLDQLCAIVTAADFEARISSGPEDALVSEYLAYADRRHTQILVDASIKQGFRYRGEVSRKTLEFWRSELKKRQLTVLSEQKRNLQTVFPWDDVDTGIGKEFLWQTWQNLGNGREIKACLAQPWGSGRCSACGSCASPEEIARLNRMGPDITRKLRIVPPAKKYALWLLFSIPEKWAFCSRDFIKAALARRLMLTCPAATAGFLNVELVEPAFFSYGMAIAKVLFSSEPAFKPSNSADSAEDIKIIKSFLPAKKAEETAFPVVLEACDAGDPAAVAREIDSLLSKYALKNQKQRSNGWLNWQISTGQARKAGIEKISFDESKSTLRITLVRWPEVFMLNKLSGNRPLRCVLSI